MITLEEAYQLCKAEIISRKTFKRVTGYDFDMLYVISTVFTRLEIFHLPAIASQDVLGKASNN